MEAHSLYSPTPVKKGGEGKGKKGGKGRGGEERGLGVGVGKKERGVRHPRKLAGSARLS